MAEALLKAVLENLSSLIQKELGLFLGFDQDLRRLSSTLAAIKATLEDAEEKQFSDRAVKDWLQKLKDAAHTLDDILDECATEDLEFQYEAQDPGLLDKVKIFFLSCFHLKHVVFRHNIAEKLKRVRERLDEIAEERIKFHLTEIHTERNTGVIDWRQTTSIIAQPQIYGREEDKDKIVDSLVGEASNFENLSIFPIVGMGGLGKTTLAQHIINNERVVNHFEQRIWVCVSEDFSLKRMSKAIIESASGHACGDLDLEPLQRKLQALLRRKRYLLVLDDVWDDNQDNWERLKYVLACGAKGASILVTTRLTTVASIVGTMPPHQLSTLSEKNCWEVFKQRAFGPNEVERRELVVIGMEIVKKCGGVPLAAKALGSLLRFKREEKEWLYVKESKLWSLPQNENSVMPALRLSYLNLPIKLRQCFAFCALFPKDTEINKQFLIGLWVANGFISSNDILEAEDIGDEVCNELYWRSFFQDVKTDEIGKITNFKMHDLVHDLAQSIAEEVCYITDDNCVTSVSERICHLSFNTYRSFKEADSIQLPQAKSLRTCLLPCKADQLLFDILRCYSLRFLLSRELNNLSSSIDNLKHLRHLNLSGGRFETLPESLCDLLNLQILNLFYCSRLKELPKRLKCLKALRDLCLTGCVSLSSLPREIGELTSLRTLSTYFVGRQRGFLLAELGRLNLKGELHMMHLERVKSVMDAKDANMGSKQVKKLVLSWDINEESQVQENVEQILEVLQPHPQQLQTLEVNGYRGVQFPEWMASPCLKYLNSVKLNDCESCLHLPSLGRLPSLKTLRIFELNHVKYVDNEAYDVGVAGGYVALEILKLWSLPNLIRLSREDGKSTFQRLSGLEIKDCPKFLVLPCLPSLKKLTISGEYSQDLLSSIHNSRSLEHLALTGNSELSCFPDGMLRDLTSLETLEISSYSKLEVLPPEIMNLNAIQLLRIHYCDSLEALTEQVLRGLHSLKILSIGWCDKFNFSAGFQYLTSLEHLRIYSCPEVEGFPEALKHMTSLQSLRLVSLRNLRSLPPWLGDLSLLRSLSIYECPQLRCLPMSIQCLSALKNLTISDCPELEKWCKEDRPKIAHITHILINNDILTQSFYLGFFYCLFIVTDLINNRGHNFGLNLDYMF